MQKKAVLFSSLFLFALVSVSVYLWIYSLRLKGASKKYSNTKIAKQVADLQRHMKIKEDLKRSLEEKYRADMISSRAAAKRLEQMQDKGNNPIKTNRAQNAN